MNRRYLRGLLAAVVIVCAAAGGPSAAWAEGCSHVDLVYYTRDTARLATELAKSPSSCADYYLSISPTAVGGPRGGSPVTTIHALGSHFHAVAEVDLKLWKTYAAANGWYATGVEYRREMTLAGYDVARGDTWAVNEVGEPSGTSMGVDVIKNAGTARQDFRQLVAGLHAGADGTPDPGAVFAADPLQVTTDLSQYKADLLSWYSDAPFWDDMHRAVRFWGQETYADADAWGVPGSSLSDRAAYLNDYFLHGSRLASAAGDATASARAFFADAYTPIGNASFRWPKPNLVTGIGFGYTDIGLVGMENFLSTQVYVLRSSSPARFGFAVVPQNATAAETVAVEDRLAGAIQGSDAGPSGACGTAGVWCDSSVADAQFNDAWRTFTDVTPPVVVPVVTGPLGKDGWYVGDVTVGWDVSDPESSFATTGCAPTTIVADTAGTPVTCTATSYGGSTTQSVTVKRDATPPVLVVPQDSAVDAVSADGAVVTYAATATDALDPAPVVTCAPQSGTVFPIGTTAVDCAATDAAGNETAATFTVHVNGAIEQVAELRDAVRSAGVPHGLETALLAKLAAAADALGAGDDACPHLAAFVTLVENAARVGHLSTADALIAGAQRVEAVLSC
jgi:hypothetical protein